MRKYINFLNRTPEYWTGYYLAKYRWAYCRRFKDIFSRIKLSEIISMYPLYHEMDVTRFYEEMERRYKEASKETNLARIRKNFLLSQSELARLSNVNLRSIQLYEQRVNDIDKADTDNNSDDKNVTFTWATSVEDSDTKKD